MIYLVVRWRREAIPPHGSSGWRLDKPAMAGHLWEEQEEDMRQEQEDGHHGQGGAGQD